MTHGRMKLQWKESGSVDHELIWGLIGLLALTAATLVRADELLADAGYRCQVRAVTGWPCPTCGATRASVAAARLKFGEAFRASPLAAALFIGLAVYVPYALVTIILRTRRLRISGVSRAEKRVALGFAVLLVLANWAYLLLASPS